MNSPQVDDKQQDDNKVKIPGAGSVVRPKPTPPQVTASRKIQQPSSNLTQRDAQQPATSQASEPQVQKPVPQVDDPSKTVGKPAAAKEAEFVSGVGVSEKAPVVEVREPGELPEDVKGWLERVERDDVAEPPTVVHKGKPVVSPAAPADVTVTLPLSEEGVKKGLKQRIVESIRWLAVWCVRLVKKYHGKVFYGGSKKDSKK